MTDEQYQKIMADLGMPNSRSLLQALQQVANEAAQETQAAERERCAKLCDSETLIQHGEFGAGWVEGAKACAALIRGPNAELTGNPGQHCT